MRKLSLIQGYYYILTGIWPILHLKSFMFVTGHKYDTWLVQMVGLLSVSIGMALVTRPFGILAFCTALSFTLIDMHYTVNGTISKVYQIDAIIQLFFLGWVILIWQKKNINYFSKKKLP